jgi:type II secretory pathway component GspD/PulD (secretin)
MSARMSIKCLTLAAFVVVGLVGQTMAQHEADKSDTARPARWSSVEATARPILVQRVYEVADLVTPVDNYPFPNTSTAPLGLQQGDRAIVQSSPQPGKAGGLQAPRQTFEHELIELIQKTVAPESWSARGGWGSMDYFPLGMSLVTNQTAEIQEQIEKLLAALRHAQDVEVQVEVRLITAPEAAFEQIALDYNVRLDNQDVAPTAASVPPPNQSAESTTVRTAYLTEQQAFRFMQAVQGDRRTTCMQAPKLTVFNGQTASVEISQTQFFVTGVDTKEAKGERTFVPRNEPVTLGFQLAVRPVVAPDRSSVHLNLKANQTDLASVTVPLFPITTSVTPVFEGGAQGQPIPFTQLIQQPQFNKFSVDRTLKIPNGSTVLLGDWKRFRETVDEFAPPLLAKIPYINRMFKTVGYSRCEEAVVLLVTARIVSEEKKPHPVESARLSPNADLERLQMQLADLMAKYHRACSEGRLAEARDLAGKALLLDPTCFGNRAATRER